MMTIQSSTAVSAISPTTKQVNQYEALEDQLLANLDGYSIFGRTLEAATMPLLFYAEYKLAQYTASLYGLNLHVNFADDYSYLFPWAYLSNVVYQFRESNRTTLKVCDALAAIKNADSMTWMTSPLEPSLNEELRKRRAFFLGPLLHLHGEIDSTTISSAKNSWFPVAPWKTVKLAFYGSFRNLYQELKKRINNPSDFKPNQGQVGHYLIDDIHLCKAEIKKYTNEITTTLPKTVPVDVIKLIGEYVLVPMNPQLKFKFIHPSLTTESAANS